jgi:hypothetical protein
MFLLLLSVCAVTLCRAQTVVLWSITTYSATALGCGGTVTPLYFEALTNPTCNAAACFCTTGAGSACKSTVCANFTTPAAPPIPSGFFGYTGYSDSTCSTPSQVRAAPVGCSTYGGGSVSASCSLNQLFFAWSPLTTSCSGGGGTALQCDIASPTCGATANGACGVSAKNNCGSATTTITTTTTSATTTRPAASAALLSFTGVVLVFCLVAF